jgi:hypothetical protein
MALSAEARELADKMLLWRARPDVMVLELFGVMPDPWQIDVLQAFPHNQRIAMKACKGPGKAQPNQTLMPTPDGMRLFGDLKVGDRVFAGDGSITRVKAIYERGILPVYRMSFDDGSSTLACGEHLWKVRGRTERRHDIWSVLSTQQIIARGVREKNGRWAGRHFEIPRQGAAQFPKRPTPIDPYFLGVWLGDGIRFKTCYVSKPTPEISTELRRRGLIVSEPYRGIVTVRGQGKGLKQLGIFDKYSYEKSVPEDYKLGDEPTRRDVLCGLMDTDGGIDADGHMEFSSTSHQLAEDVVWLVRSLGGTAFIKAAVKKPFYRDAEGNKIPGRDCYRVTVRTPFNPFLIEGRKARWIDPNSSPSTVRYLTRRIDAVELEGEENCRCIEVEHPDKLYLTNDFIVTHNTCVLAWLAWNFLLTRPYPKIAATSISADNLADNLWTEMAVWQQKSPLLKAMFKWTKTRIEAKDHPETWWMAARSFKRDADRAQQANTLAGLHADYIMFILDESGGIPDAVMAAAEAALSSCIEGHILQAGNPTHLEGPLYRAVTSEKRLWWSISITGDPDDPKRSPRVSAQWAHEQIEKYGRDDPWVLINVFGQFPPSSLNALIGPDEVREAMQRIYTPHDIMGSPLIFGIDVARYGDDASVIFPRRGLQAFIPTKKRSLNGRQGAAIVSRMWQSQNPDGVFIDDTGGYGATWIEALNDMNYAPIPVGFSNAAHDDKHYFNKRAEMYFDLVGWIRSGGALPNVPELIPSLSQTTYTFKGNRLLLEPKEDIKLKIGYSPDDADALACTFAEAVAMRAKEGLGKSRHTAEYDPFAERQSTLASAVSSSYDPFRR